MIRNFICIGAVAVALAGLPAKAADFVSLEWGEFKIDAESAVKPASISVVNGKQELSLAMTLDTLMANADGAKTEGSSSFSGEFLIQQPHYVSLPALSVELKGHIIKTAGSTASLEVTIGGSKQVLKWEDSEVVSAPFEKTVTTPISAGQLPVPFPISASAVVNKNQGSGAVLVSLESIVVKIGRVRLASFQH